MSGDQETGAFAVIVSWFKRLLGNNYITVVSSIERRVFTA